MSYISWLKFKVTIEDIIEFIFNGIKELLRTFIKIFRLIFYAACSLCITILGITFPVGIYFCFTVVKELFNGVPIIDTTYFGFFLLFFILPIVLVIIREVTKP